MDDSIQQPHRWSMARIPSSSGGLQCQWWLWGKDRCFGPAWSKQCWIPRMDGTWWNHTKHTCCSMIHKIAQNQRSCNELVKIWEGVPWQVQTRHAVGVPARASLQHFKRSAPSCVFSGELYMQCFYPTEPLSLFSLYQNKSSVPFFGRTTGIRLKEKAWRKIHRNRPISLTCWSPDELVNVSWTC